MTEYSKQTYRFSVFFCNQVTNQVFKHFMKHVCHVLYEYKRSIFINSFCVLCSTTTKIKEKKTHHPGTLGSLSSSRNNVMGVKGLLPCLQSITRNVSLEKYRGLTAAVDAMCWLHKGVFTGDVRALAKYQQQQREHEKQQQRQQQQHQHHDDAEYVLQECSSSSKMDPSKQESLHNDPSCSIVKRLDFDKFATAKKRPRYTKAYQTMNDLATSSCETNNADARMAMVKCVDYVIRHTEQICQKYGVEIILVIDGGSLPSKKNVDEKRRLEREEAFRKGLQADKRGDSREARKQFTRACSISHEIRHELTIQCKLRGIQFIVAPYESDAQLAKLAHDGVVDVVISEDSDLLAYGCPRVLFKIDFRSGRGDEIQIMRDLASNSSPSFRHWNHDMFVYMCILSGCDYCEGISGIGIQSAHKIVRMHRKPSKIFKMLSSNGKLPQGFEEIFWTAYNTFRHQRIYCLEKGVIEPLFPIDHHGSSNTREMWQFLGSWLEPTIGRGIADGSLHPVLHIPWAQITDRPTVKNELNDEQCQDGTTSRKNQKNDKSIHNLGGPSRSRSSLFAFFKKGNNTIKSSPDNTNRNRNKRLPLQEVTLNRNNGDSSRNDSISNSTFNGLKLTTTMVPTHFYDYSSKLVSTSFQPLSRNTSNLQYFQKRMCASKAIKKLKNRLSVKRVQEIENARRQAQQHQELTEQSSQAIIGNLQGSSSITSDAASVDNVSGQHKEEGTKPCGVKEVSQYSSSYPLEDDFSKYNNPNFDYCIDPSLSLYDCYSTEEQQISSNSKENKNIDMCCTSFNSKAINKPIVQMGQQQQFSYVNPFYSSDNERFQLWGEMQFLLQNVQVSENDEGITSYSKMTENQPGIALFEDRFCSFDYNTFHNEHWNEVPVAQGLTNDWSLIQNDDNAFSEGFDLF